MISNNDAEEILKKEYNIDNYVFLLKDILLPDFVSDEHNVIFNNKVFEKVTQIGSSKKCELVVFEVYLNDSARNRRVTITQEMFKILRNYRINNALVSFVNPDKKNYRLSLLTSKYEYDGEKIVKVLSNPRRFSYSLGYGTKTKTAYQFLINKGITHSLNELIDRFSLEVVNKQFYYEIANCYTELVGKEHNGYYTNRILSLKDIYENDVYANFGVRLIGRIMFCWFLKEKKSDNNISLIPNDYLSIDKINSCNNYYHEILEPLFFELLNKPIDSRKSEYINDCYNLIPYLNGGLFSPHNDDLYKYDKDLNNSCIQVMIPNSWFIHLYKTLNQYNFTVDENTSYDIELSIDPEMLGRIFENLLAEINPATGENAKKSTGSFYTPRDVVDYMVDSSLCEYLETKTSINTSKLKDLINYSKINDTSELFTITEKKQIINALYDVTVLDPACGSGAFPIGMLQKIVYILQEIDPDANLWFDKATENVGILLKKEFEKKFNVGSLNYIRKLSVIQNSIFGIDIQPIAVEISRLRCFLSLIIEEKIDDLDLNRGINPLPNLDFKFIIANSLKELEADEPVLSNEYHINALKDIREEYFNASPSRRIELRFKFDDIQKQMFKNTIYNLSKTPSLKYKALSEWEPFKDVLTDWFDPEWMFGIKNGFDIIIGNPPYVGSGSRGTSNRMDCDDKIYYRKHFPNSAEYKINLYALFMELGIRLNKNGGISSFIVPDSFLLGMYFSKIRKYMLEKCSIKQIAILGSNVFSACVGYSVVYLLKKSVDNQHQITFINAKNNGGFDDTYRFSYEQSYAKRMFRYRFRVFFDEKTKNLIDKIEMNSTPLGEYYTGHTGVRSRIGQKKIISKNQEKFTYKRGIISGSQILPYKVLYNGDYINIDPTILNAGGFEERVICYPKIFVRQTADTIIAAFDDEGLYHLNNVHSFSPKFSSCWDIKYILALLNSNLMKYYYEIIANEKGRPMPQTDIESLEQLPIKYNENEAKIVCDLVEKILFNVDLKENDYLQQINNIIYGIYGLDKNDISIIEDYFKE